MIDAFDLRRPRSTSMDSSLQDKLLIRELLERWVVWRDAGDWERFATVWHPEGVMMATWFQGRFADFIRVTREGWDKGVSILHFLGGSAIDVAGDRAIAQTKMTISQRGAGRRRAGAVRRRLHRPLLRLRRPPRGPLDVLHRQPIYEKDRIDPIDPGAELRSMRRRSPPSPKVPSSRLHPDADRLHGEDGHADAEGTGGRSALPARRRMAGRRAARALAAAQLANALAAPSASSVRSARGRAFSSRR